MTVIRPNSISGVTSITAQANEINVFKSDGTLAGLQLNGVNVNTTSGISTYAALNVTGNVSVGGTLTYEDVTNIDSVGIITARDDVNIIGDNKKLKFGAGNDLNLYSTGTNGWVFTPQSGADLYMGTNAGEIYIQTGSSGNDTAIKVNSGGSVELNHSTNKKLETTSTGVTVTGDMNISDGTGQSHYQITQTNGNTVKFGIVSGSDIELSGSSNNSMYFKTNNTERLRITSAGYVHFGSTGHGTNKVGGQAITGEDFDPYVKILGNVNNRWLMQARNDTNTGSNGIFIRAGNNSNDYSLYACGTDESKAHIVARGDGRIGIGIASPEATRLHCRDGDSGGSTSSGAVVTIEKNATATLQFLSPNSAYNAIRFGDNNDNGAGWIQYNHSDNSMQFGTNGSEKLRIKSDGDITHTGGRIYSTRASGEAGLLLGSGNAGGATLYLDGDSNGDWSGSDYAYIRHNTSGDLEIHATNPNDDGEIYFKVGSGTEKLRIDSAGRLLLGTTASFNGGILCIGSGQGANHPSGEGFKLAPSANTITFLDSSSNGGDTGNIQLWNTVYNNSSAKMEMYHPAGNLGGMRLYTHDGVSLKERVSIKSNGEVDISDNVVIHSVGNSQAVDIEQQTDGNYTNVRLRNFYTGSAKNMMAFLDQNGNVRGSIVINNSNTTYNTSSDYRLKENEVPISDGIERLKLLKPYRFNWKDDPSITLDGFFAHEVTPAVPEAIVNEKDGEIDEEGNGYQQMDYAKITPLLTAALQEAIAEIETLKTKVAALEGS